MKACLNNPVYCVNCEKELDATWSHCPSCGASQQSTANPAFATSPQPVVLLPIQPGHAPQQSPSTTLVLDECARQYRNLTWLQFVGIFLLGAYFIGLASIIYAMVQKPAFRRKVAELGCEPEAWERPLRAHATKVLLTGPAVFLVIAAAVAVIIFSIGASPAPSPSSTP